MELERKLYYGMVIALCIFGAAFMLMMTRYYENAGQIEEYEKLLAQCHAISLICGEVATYAWGQGPCFENNYSILDEAIS